MCIFLNLGKNVKYPYIFEHAFSVVVIIVVVSQISTCRCHFMARAAPAGWQGGSCPCALCPAPPAVPQSS